MSSPHTVHYYQFSTSAGVVSLMPQAGGRYQVVFQSEKLGSYHSAAAAAVDVAGGHTFMPSSNIDLGELQIPNDLSEWEKRVFGSFDRLRQG